MRVTSALEAVLVSFGFQISGPSTFAPHMHLCTQTPGTFALGQFLWASTCCQLMAGGRKLLIASVAALTASILFFTSSPPLHLQILIAFRVSRLIYPSCLESRLQSQFQNSSQFQVWTVLVRAICSYIYIAYTHTWVPLDHELSDVKIVPCGKI